MSPRWVVFCILNVCVFFLTLIAHYQHTSHVPRCGSHNGSALCSDQRLEDYEHAKEAITTVRPMGAPGPTPAILFSGMHVGGSNRFQHLWWTCKNTCASTVYFWPVGDIAEQLNVLGVLISKSREEGFSVSYVQDPALGYGWNDIFIGPHMDVHDALLGASEEDANKHKISVDDQSGNQSLLEESAKGVLSTLSMIEISGAKLECTLHSSMVWEEIIWEQIGKGDRTVMCVRTAHLEINGSDARAGEDLAWFFSLLKPNVRIQSYVMNYRTEHDWNMFTWVGVHVQDSFISNATNQATSELLQGHMQQMQMLRMTIPNHELGEWRYVQPLRFMLVAGNNMTQDVVIEKFRPDIVATEPNVPATTPYAQAEKDLCSLLLLASCRAVIGTPGSLFGGMAALIGQSFYIEPTH